MSSKLFGSAELLSYYLMFNMQSAYFGARLTPGSQHIHSLCNDREFIAREKRILT